MLAALEIEMVIMMMIPLRAKNARGRKNDIQSWVLIRPFSVSFGPRNGREIAIRPAKKAEK